MLVGATACALQVTASLHRDPPAEANTHPVTRDREAGQAALGTGSKNGVGTFGCAVEEIRAASRGEGGAAAQAASGSELRRQRGEAGRRHGVGGGAAGGVARHGAFGVGRSGGEGMRTSRCPLRHVHRTTAVAPRHPFPPPRHHPLRLPLLLRQLLSEHVVRSTIRFQFVKTHL